jgi:hypothetical protein
MMTGSPKKEDEFEKLRGSFLNKDMSMSKAGTIKKVGYEMT